MVIPKEITDKMQKVNELQKEIRQWVEENIDIDGTNLQNLETDFYLFVNVPKGTEQGEGEYCEQRQLYEDSYEGSHYYPTEDGRYYELEYWC